MHLSWTIKAVSAISLGVAFACPAQTVQMTPTLQPGQVKSVPSSGSAPLTPVSSPPAQHFQPTSTTQTTLLTRPRYLLRPGDTLQLQYRLTPDLNQTVVVQPDGFIGINVAGEVHIAGLTVQQAHDLIVQQDGTELNNPELNLVLEEFTRPYVVVAGQVAKPGQIEIRDNMTALSAILMAGGFTENAKGSQVIVYRKVDDNIAEVKELNLRSVHKTKQLEQDLALQPGDMILVPHDRVSRLQHYVSIVSVAGYFTPLMY